MLDQLIAQLQKSFRIVDSTNGLTPTREWALSEDECLPILSRGFTPELLPEQTVPRTNIESLTRFMNGSKFLQATHFGISVGGGTDGGAIIQLYVLTNPVGGTV